MIGFTNAGIGFAIIICMTIFLVKYKYLYVPLFLCACYLSLGQKFFIADLDFPMLRVVILCIWIRILLNGGLSNLRFNIIDKIFIVWVVVSVINYTLLYQTQAAFINRMGFAYNALGTYFCFRCILKNTDEIMAAFRMLVIFSVPIAIAAVVEHITGRNLFAVFGGVPEISEVRYGKVRSVTVFAHPILMGTFGAVLMPFSVVLWWLRDRVLSVIGFLSTTSIVMASASSGPLLAFIGGLIGFALWPLRHSMQFFRWSAVLLGSMLALVMKAPVYYLPSRLADIFGGSGWYRSYLIDQGISHFKEWWFMGTKVTAHWMPFVLAAYPDKADITNQYLGEGLNGGIWKLGLFVALIVFSYKAIGKTLKKNSMLSRGNEMFVWAVGVSLSVHALSFISVSYHSQIEVFWYMILAVCSTFENDILQDQIGEVNTR